LQQQLKKCYPARFGVAQKFPLVASASQSTAKAAIDFGFVFGARQQALGQGESLG